jgi:drug/metabolite transporter (DMT)-like permease
MNTELIGYLWLMIPVLAWGSAPALIAISTRKGASVWAIVLWRLITSVIVLAPLCLILGSTEWNSDIRGWLWGLMAAVLGPGLGQASYIVSIRKIGGGKAITISYLYVIFSQVIAILFLGEPFYINLAAGAVLSIIGVWIVATSSGSSNNDFNSMILGRLKLSYRLIGLLLALASAIAWAIASNLNKLALEYFDPIQLTLYRNSAVAIIILPLALQKGLRKGLGRVEFTAIIIAGVAGFALGIYSFLEAINILGVSRTVLVTSLVPILGQFISRYMVKERISKRQILGTILTALGVFIGSMRYA